MADSATEPEKIWWRVLKRWWKAFGIVAALTLAWLLLSSLGIVAPESFGPGVLIAAVLLYTLAFPISLVFRLDQLTEQFGFANNTTAQLVALLYVGANFTLLGILHGMLRQWKSRRGSPAALREDKLGPSRFNGAGDDSEPH